MEALEHWLNSSCTFFISCVDLYPSMSLDPLPSDRGRQLFKGTGNYVKSEVRCQQQLPTQWRQKL